MRGWRRGRFTRIQRGGVGQGTSWVHTLGRQAARGVGGWEVCGGLDATLQQSRVAPPTLDTTPRLTLTPFPSGRPPSSPFKARACAYALPESAFDSSSSEGAAREAWRTANLKRYEAMEATHFASNASESILATPQQPQRSASGFSDSSEDDSPASAPVPNTRGGTPLGAPIPPNPASTGFKINLGAVKRDPVDNIKPLAVPHTPKADVVARLDARLGEVEGKGAIGDGGTLMSTVEIDSTFRVSGAGLAEVSPSWASPSSSASPAAATKARLQQGAAYKALAARAPSDSQWGVVELGEKLGQGTYGSVYRAITQGVGGQTPKGADGLAAKLLKLDAKNAVAVAREVEILKQVSSRNAPHVGCVGQERAYSHHHS